MKFFWGEIGVIGVAQLNQLLLHREMTKGDENHIGSGNHVEFPPPL